LKDKTSKRKNAAPVTLSPLAPLGEDEALRTLLSVPPPVKKKKKRRKKR